MKKILTSLVLLLAVSLQAQTITVNGNSLLVSENNSFPLWLAAGSTISPNPPVHLLSVVEYAEISNGEEMNLIYSGVLNITQNATVPEGKVWKVVSAMEVGTQNMDIPVDSLEIGDDYAGGIVFYLDGNGGGKVCAKSHTESAGEWDEAINFATDLVDSGFDDWYLPTRNELELVYNQIADLGNFQPSYYWSSSEYSSNTAWSVGFNDGNTDSNLKHHAGRFRVIRAF
jgi:hypothetical protein